LPLVHCDQPAVFAKTYCFGIFSGLVLARIART
jgi:hypothetical protein